jgi:tetratricopeptide (TPR) repeat protein
LNRALPLPSYYFILWFDFNCFKEASIWEKEKDLEIDRKAVNTLKNKGRAFYDMGRFSEATIWYEKALEIDPKEIKVLINKSHALYDLGEEKEALTYIDKALEVDPNDAKILELKKLLQESIK